MCYNQFINQVTTAMINHLGNDIAVSLIAALLQDKSRVPEKTKNEVISSYLLHKPEEKNEDLIAIKTDRKKHATPLPTEPKPKWAE